MVTRSGNQSSGRVCAYQDCKAQTSGSDHYLCSQHYLAARQGTITKCSRCSNFKPARYPLCGGCFVGNPKPVGSQQTSPAIAETGNRYEVESSPAWEKGDANSSYFYVYILRLTSGEFYVGQTRELRERLSEHRDGRVATTKGKSPELVWFTELPSREEAARLESELKHIRDRDERSIRRMIIRFQSLVRELERE